MKIDTFQICPTIGDGVRVIIEFDNNTKREMELNTNSDFFIILMDTLKAYSNLSKEIIELKNKKQKKK